MGTMITNYLYVEATAAGKVDAEAKAWVAARWLEIAQSPYNNKYIRSYVYLLLKAAMKKPDASRTRGEKTLLRSFATYIQQRRTYLAQQALDMYDTWKRDDELYRAITGQNRQLSSLFYYGTVPFDFYGTLSALTGVGATGGGAIGAVYAANKFWNGIKYVEEAESGLDGLVPSNNLFEIMNDLKLLKTVQGLTAVTSAPSWEAAFAILTSIAIDQFEAIETARPNLVAALAEAGKAVDLNQLQNSPNGEDMLLLYWGRAMETWDPEDPQVIEVAAMAQTRAEQSGYAK